MKKEKSKNEDYREKKFSFRYLLHDFVKITAGIPGLIWFRPKIIYAGQKQKHRGGLLVISNHIGKFDPMYLLFAIWYRRQRFICMKEFYDNPFTAFLFRAFLTIPIDRENPGMDTFREITERLKGGACITMFPGGKIDMAATALDSFKSGMILMALRSGVPVLPVYMVKRKHWYSRFCCVIGEAVDIKKECGEKPAFADIKRMTELVIEREKALCSLLPEKYR